MKTVFFDIDTQLDFVLPAGALYVPGAEEILPAVAALNRLAASRGSLVISTLDAHAEDDEEFRRWPHHCIAGTLGQQKAAQTLLDKRASLPSRPIDLPARGISQLLVEKQELDLFTNPNVSALLESLGAERYVVYGVAAEHCVRHAVRGLLRTGKRVELVADAVRGIDPGEVRRMQQDFTAAGGILTTVGQVSAA